MKQTDSFIAGVFQIVALSTSILTLTMTNMQLCFIGRDIYYISEDERLDVKKSWLEILQRNVLLTPFFLANCVFKVLTVSQIFTIFNIWGLMIVMLWSVMYHHLFMCLHRNYTHLGIFYNLFFAGPLNTIIIIPGYSIPSHKWEHLELNGFMNGPPIRYKALIRMSVWMHFCYFGIWLIYGPVMQLITDGSTYTSHIREFGITLQCIFGGNLSELTLAIWSIGLFSCLIVEIYLKKFPQALGLNKENDYCSAIKGVSQKEAENLDIANETFDIGDTFIELSQNILVE